MKSTLAISFTLVLAACGPANPDDNARPSAANETVADDANAAATAPMDARTAEVLGAVEKAVGAVDPAARTAIGYADIGGDEREEALVYLADPGRCGSGGCSLIILTPSGKSWRALGQTTVTQLPVHRLRTRREGWNDLAVVVGGGGRPSGTALLRFADGHYPSNPSVQPILNRLPEGARLLIADNPDALAPAL